MKKFLLLLLFLVCGVLAVAQKINLDKQVNFNYKRMFVLDSLNVKEPDFKNIDVELRIYYTCWMEEPYNSKLIQIVKTKENEWSAKSYKYYYYNQDFFCFKNAIIEPLILGKTWAKSWDEIIKNNYLNLLSEKDIKKNNDLFIVISDGKDYTIEILTNKRKRRITYNNPQIKLETYKEAEIIISEYKMFCDFLSLLNEELNFEEFGEYSNKN